MSTTAMIPPRCGAAAKNLQQQRRVAPAFGTEDFADVVPGQTADAQGTIQFVEGCYQGLNARFGTPPSLWNAPTPIFARCDDGRRETPLVGWLGERLLTKRSMPCRPCFGESLGSTVRCSAMPAQPSLDSRSRRYGRRHAV